MKLEDIKPGMVLLDIHRHRMGNTMVLGCWEVEIVSVDADTCTAVVRWNRNPPSRWGRRRLERLKMTKTPALLEQEARCRRWPHRALGWVP